MVKGILLTCVLPFTLSFFNGVNTAPKNVAPTIADLPFNYNIVKDGNVLSTTTGANLENYDWIPLNNIYKNNNWCLFKIKITATNQQYFLNSPDSIIMSSDSGFFPNTSPAANDGAIFFFDSSFNRVNSTYATSGTSYYCYFNSGTFPGTYYAFNAETLSGDYDETDTIEISYSSISSIYGLPFSINSYCTEIFMCDDKGAALKSLSAKFNSSRSIYVLKSLDDELVLYFSRQSETFTYFQLRLKLNGVYSYQRLETYDSSTDTVSLIMNDFKLSKPFKVTSVNFSGDNSLDYLNGFTFFNVDKSSALASVSSRFYPNYFYSSLVPLAIRKEDFQSWSSGLIASQMSSSSDVSTSKNILTFENGKRVDLTYNFYKDRYFEIWSLMFYDNNNSAQQIDYYSYSSNTATSAFANYATVINLNPACRLLSADSSYVAVLSSAGASFAPWTDGYNAAYSSLYSSVYNEGYNVGYPTGQENPTVLSWLRSCTSLIYQIFNYPIFGSNFTVGSLIGALLVLMIFAWIIHWFR